MLDPSFHLALCMTRVFNKARRIFSKASELVVCFGGVALEGGQKGGVVFFQLDAVLSK